MTPADLLRYTPWADLSPLDLRLLREWRPALFEREDRLAEMEFRFLDGRVSVRPTGVRLTRRQIAVHRRAIARLEAELARHRLALGRHRTALANDRAEAAALAQAARKSERADASRLRRPKSLRDYLEKHRLRRSPTLDPSWSGFLGDLAPRVSKLLSALGYSDFEDLPADKWKLWRHGGLGQRSVTLIEEELCRRGRHIYCFYDEPPHERESAR